MPDEATLLDLPARVDYLQRKKTLLLACTQPSSTLHMSLAAQPSALATEVLTSLLPNIWSRNCGAALYWSSLWLLHAVMCSGGLYESTIAKATITSLCVDKS